MSGRTYTQIKDKDSHLISDDAYTFESLPIGACFIAAYDSDEEINYFNGFCKDTDEPFKNWFVKGEVLIKTSKRIAFNMFDCKNVKLEDARRVLRVHKFKVHRTYED